MPDIWGIAAVFAKLGLYIGFAGYTGLMIVSCLYSGFVAPIHRVMKRQARALACLALAATVVGFMLRGAALTGGIDGMVDPEMLGYGQALLFKVFLVGLLLILAAANKLRFVPSMQSGEAKAARHLARSIEVEAIVVLVVLATTATLTSVLTLPS